jgi:replicative DNA helicase
MSDANALRAALAATRVQHTMGTEAAKAAGALPPGTLPTPAELARQQVQEAVARGRMDLTGAPRFAWRSLDRLIGPLLPGYFLTVGALQGNGKSAFLMSHMDASAEAGTASLYVPLEVDPHECRTQWACWKLGLSYLYYKRQEWGYLPDNAREAVEATLEEQIVNPFIHFAPDRRITLTGLEKWVRWAHANLGVRQVILDHFHRMDHGADQASHRLAVGEAARRLRDIGRELEIVMIAACQLNRSLDPFDAYKPPVASRVRDSSGLQDEPNVTLMISRVLDPAASKEQLTDVRDGTLEEWRVALPNVMEVTCRKHRDDGAALNRRVRLAVENGRVMQPAPDTPPHWSER